MTDQNGLQRSGNGLVPDSATVTISVDRHDGSPVVVVVGDVDSARVTMDEVRVWGPDEYRSTFGPGLTYTIHFPDGIRVLAGGDGNE